MYGIFSVSPDKAVQKIRQDVAKAIKDLQKPDNVEKLEKLKIQIEKLELSVDKVQLYRPKDLYLNTKVIYTNSQEHLHQ